MTAEVLYNRYVIKPEPIELQESGFWTINLSIERHTGEAVHARKFYGTKQPCKNKEEAIKRCFAYGKQIIDGQVTNCSVQDL